MLKNMPASGIIVISIIAALFVLAAILYYVIMHFGARKYEKLGG